MKLYEESVIKSADSWIWRVFSPVFLLLELDADEHAVVVVEELADGGEG